jgi:hypothetical protein
VPVQVEDAGDRAVSGRQAHPQTEGLNELEGGNACVLALMTAQHYHELMNAESWMQDLVR